MGSLRFTPPRAARQPLESRLGVGRPSRSGRRRSGPSRSGRLRALVICLAFAGLVLEGTGCRLNSAARPVGVQPEITSLVIDPVTLKPVAPAEEARPVKSEDTGGLDALEERGESSLDRLLRERLEIGE